MKKIIHAEALNDYKVRVTFSDDTQGVADLSDLVGKGIFALWENYHTFRQLQIGDSGELIWADQIDLCPDALYIKITGKQPDDVFPRLKSDTACA